MKASPRQGLVVAAVALGLFPAAASAQLPLPTLPVTLPTLPSVPGLPITLPTDPAQLASLLSGANQAQLTALIQALGGPEAAFAAISAMTPAQAAPVIAQVQALAAVPGAPTNITALAGLLTAAAGGGSTGGGSTGGGSTGGGSTGGGSTGGGSTGGGATTPAPNRAFRAEITKLKVAKNRRSVAVSVACPAQAPNCSVAMAAKLGSKYVSKMLVATVNSTSTSTLKLNSATSKRLRRKGGQITVLVGTYGSTLAPATKSVKAAKPKPKRKKH